MEWVTLGGLGCLSILVALAASQVTSLSSKLTTLIELNPPRTSKMQTLKSNVTRPNGDVTEIITERGAGESEKDWFTRHDSAVAYAKAN